MYRLAINGYGRIGRSFLRALYDCQQQGQHGDLQIVAINEPADIETIQHLTRFDSTHGRFSGDIHMDNGNLVLGQRTIALSHHSRIEDIQWHDIDLVLECSGCFRTRIDAQKHLARGADKVLFSHPADASVDMTVVFGVNHEALEPHYQIVSNASCTTNGCVPILQLIDRRLGIESASITTIHSAMNDQPVIDAYHNTDLRKTRSASQSMIPVDTALAKGIVRLLPELDGLISAQAVRIPTVNVSAMDITIQLKTSVTVAEVNHLLREFSETKPRIVAYNTEPLASIDFNHDSHSCIVDATQTRISGDRLLKLFIWFDNEWGFAHRMIDVAAYLYKIMNPR